MDVYDPKDEPDEDQMTFAEFIKSFGAGAVVSGMLIGIVVAAIVGILR